MTHVLYLGTSDYVEVFVRHNESTTQNIYVDQTITVVTCTML